VQTLPPSSAVIPSDVHDAGISVLIQALLPPQLAANTSDMVKIAAAPIRHRYGSFTLPSWQKYFGILIHVLHKDQGPERFFFRTSPPRQEVGAFGGVVVL